MTGKLNVYGDSLVPTDGGHGADITSQRQDELDLGALAAVKERRAPVVVDLGGGFGTLSAAMFEAGARVTMIDISDMAGSVFGAAKAKNRERAKELTFVRKDFLAINNNDLPGRIDILYSQRALHHLRYNDLLELLTTIRKRMPEGSVAFLSVGGFDTEYGLSFEGRERSVEERYGKVAPDMQEKHGIHHEITIYRPEEFAGLLEKAGFTVTSINPSSFGNIKAFARV